MRAFRVIAFVQTKLVIDTENYVNLPYKTIYYSTIYVIAIINIRLSFSAGYRSAIFFYNSKNLNCIGALSVLKICSHIFMFLKSNWSRDFGHAETGSGAKKRVVFWRDLSLK